MRKDEEKPPLKVFEIEERLVVVKQSKARAVKRRRAWSGSRNTSCEDGAWRVVLE